MLLSWRAQGTDLSWPPEHDLLLRRAPHTNATGCLSGLSRHPGRDRPNLQQAAVPTDVAAEGALQECCAGPGVGAVMGHVCVASTCLCVCCCCHGSVLAPWGAAGRSPKNKKTKTKKSVLSMHQTGRGLLARLATFSACLSVRCSWVGSCAAATGRAYLCSTGCAESALLVLL